MKVTRRIVQIAFAIPWLVFGVQHFMYADFVSNLVPSYFPARTFWAYFTGAAMIAAGTSLIVNILPRFAAAMLGVMLLIFISLIHVPTIAADASMVNWTRALQDLAIASTAFSFATIGGSARNKLPSGVLYKASSGILAVLLIVFGIQQLMGLDFLVARVAAYLPLRILWVYVTGVAMIAGGVGFLIGIKARWPMLAVGMFMLALNSLLHVHLLATSLYNPLYWTAAMLDLAITCGVVLLATTSAQANSDSPVNESKA